MANKDRCSRYQEKQRTKREQDPVLAAAYRKSEAARKKAQRKRKKEKDAAAAAAELDMANQNGQGSNTLATHQDALLTTLASMRADRRADDKRRSEGNINSEERRNELELTRLGVELARLGVEKKRIDAQENAEQRRFDSEESERQLGFRATGGARPMRCLAVAANLDSLADMEEHEEAVQKAKSAEDTFLPSGIFDVVSAGLGTIAENPEDKKPTAAASNTTTSGQTYFGSSAGSAVNPEFCVGGNGAPASSFGNVDKLKGFVFGENNGPSSASTVLGQNSVNVLGGQSAPTGDRKKKRASPEVALEKANVSSTPSDKMPAVNSP